MRLRLLFANTFLLRIRLPRPLVRLGHLHAKPAVQERAAEYGSVLPEYDVAALCELFRRDDLASLLDHWQGPTAPAVAVGPDETISRRATGSGLVTLVNGPGVDRRERIVFSDQGSSWRDSDAWSSKGVLMTEIALPRGGLELYSTHLIAGGDIAETPSHLRRTEARRFAQVDELCAMVDAVHRPGNAVLVVGDFNVEAGTPAGDRLAMRMGDAGLVDLWAEHGDGPGWTSDAVAVGDPITRPDPDDPRFCADPAPPHPDAHRIDYAFHGRRDDAAPAMTVHHLRRRVFRRDPTARKADEMPLLSDHVALDLDLEFT